MEDALCYFRDLVVGKIKVRCGDWDFNDTTEITHQDRKAKIVHIHPNFKLTRKQIPQNDVALIYLDHNFKITPFVDTICLPKFSPKDQRSLPIDCFATGYGKDRFGNY